MSTGNPDEREKAGVESVPEPARGYRASKPDDPSDDARSARHVYEKRDEAAQVAERLGSRTRIAKRRVDGRQRHVIEKQVADESADGINMEAWVEAPYDLEEL